VYTESSNIRHMDLRFKYFMHVYYEAEGGVIELLETGAPYAPHVRAKITWKRKIEICASKLCLERGKSCVRSFQTGFRITPTVTKMV